MLPACPATPQVAPALLCCLQSSLTRAQALMITCVTADPGKQARQEALATLQFASMTRKVQTCPRLNVLPEKEPKVRPVLGLTACHCAFFNLLRQLSAPPGA